MSDRPQNLERKDALLTSTQRERLRQQSNQSQSQSEFTAQHRRRIIDRIRHGTADLSYLCDHLSPSLITEAFSDAPPSEREPMNRETIITALAFYIRACDTRGWNPEEILSEAVTQVYDRQSDKVLGHSRVELSVTDRETALQSAKHKLDADNPDRLSTDELRALAETDYRQLAPLSMPDSKPALRQLVCDNLRTIYPGLEIIQTHPQSPSGSGSGSVPPDLLATTDDGRIAVLEINSPVHETTEESAINRLRDLILEYGGSQNVIGILVTAVKQTLEIKVTKIHETERTVSTIPLAEL